MRKWAIVGGGNIGKQARTALLELPEEAEVVALVDPVQSIREMAEAQWSCKTFNSVAAMLASGIQVDVGFLGNPSFEHTPCSIALMEAGAHVVIEKPAAIHSAQFRELKKAVDAARRRGVRAFTVVQKRLGRAAQLFHAALRSGELGKLISLSAIVPWERTMEVYYAPTGKARTWRGLMEFEGGGALMNQAFHDLDMLIWLTCAGLQLADDDTDPVLRLSGAVANVNHVGGISVEDTASVMMVMRNFVTATLMTTVATKGAKSSLRLITTQGQATMVEGGGLSEWNMGQTSFDAAANQLLLETNEAGKGAAAFADPMGIGHAGHKAQFEMVGKALQSGDPCMFDFAATIPATRWACKFYETAEGMDALPGVTLA